MVETWHQLRVAMDVSSPSFCWHGLLSATLIRAVHSGSGHRKCAHESISWRYKAIIAKKTNKIFHLLFLAPQSSEMTYITIDRHTIKRDGERRRKHSNMHPQPLASDELHHYWSIHCIDVWGTKQLESLRKGRTVRVHLALKSRPHDLTGSARGYHTHH